jgi:hypothetical protein
MMKSIFALLCLLFAASAFQPLPTLTPGRLIAGSSSSSSSGRTTTLADFVLNAAAEEENDGEAAVSASADGTYYDDEVGHGGSYSAQSTVCTIEGTLLTVSYFSHCGFSPPHVTHTHTARTRSPGGHFRHDEGTSVEGSFDRDGQ